MRFTYLVEIEVERTEGKFAARDEIAEQLAEWLDGANEQTVDSVGADGDSTYEVTDWTVEEQEQPKRARRRASAVEATS